MNNASMTSLIHNAVQLMEQRHEEWKKEHPNGAIGHKWSTNKGQKKTPEQIENNRKAQKEYASRADYVNPASGRHWYTNGTVNVFTYECPIGYKPGMVRR